MTLKKIFGKLHLWLGLLSGAVVLVVALTGSLLVFEKELDEWANQDFYFAPAPGGQRLTIDSLMHRVQAADPALRISEVEEVQNGQLRNVLVSGQKDGHTWIAAVNPYTGEVVRTVRHDQRFFTIVLHLHRYLLAGETGKAVTGVCCLIFLVLLVTGIVLWWPKRIRQLKQRLQVKWSGSRKRLNWDLHAVGGFYAYLVLFVIALTGLTWSYKWFNNGIFQLFDGRPMQRYTPPANRASGPVAYGFYEQVYQEAVRRLPYKGKLSLLLPKNDSLSVTVSKENFEASVTNVVDYLYFERGTVHLLKERLYENESLGMKVRRLVYPIHTGQIYGWPTKIIAFLVCLLAASLPITGLRIWLGRRKKARKATAASRPWAVVSRPAAARTASPAPAEL